MTADASHGEHGHEEPIDDYDQIDALASAIRQEIVDTVVASGPCTARDIARELGRPSDSLYYHLRRLVEADLLEESRARGPSGKEQSFYQVKGHHLALRYVPDDPENVRRVSRVIATMLRVAERDFKGAFKPGLAVTEGSERNLWGLRMKGWLTPDEVRLVNGLLEELHGLFHRGRRRENTELVGLTWVLAAVDPQPTYRSRDPDD